MTLYLAIPKTWENRTSSTVSLTDNTSVDFLNIVKQQSLDSWISTKSVYLHLTSNQEGPIKHQLRWANDLTTQEIAGQSTGEPFIAMIVSVLLKLNYDPFK